MGKYADRTKAAWQEVGAASAASDAADKKHAPNYPQERVDANARNERAGANMWRALGGKDGK